MDNNEKDFIRIIPKSFLSIGSPNETKLSFQDSTFFEKSTDNPQEELEMKKARIRLWRQQAAEKRKQNKIKMQQRACTSRLTVMRDINKLKQQLFQCTKQYKSKPKEKVSYCVLPTKTFAPIFATFIQGKDYKYNGEKLTDYFPHTCLIKIGEHEKAQAQNPIIKVEDLLSNILQSHPEASFDKAESTEALSKRDSTKMIIAIPNMYNLEDNTPRKMKNEDYSENFSYFKVVTEKLVSFLKKNLDNNQHVIHMTDIRELLEVAGEPLIAEEERQNCKDVLTKVQIQKDVLKEDKNKFELEEKLLKNIYEDSKTVMKPQIDTKVSLSKEVKIQDIKDILLKMINNAVKIAESKVRKVKLYKESKIDIRNSLNLAIKPHAIKSNWNNTNGIQNQTNDINQKHERRDIHIPSQLITREMHKKVERSG